jgi:hypothetical protein
MRATVITTKRLPRGNHTRMVTPPAMNSGATLISMARPMMTVPTMMDLMGGILPNVFVMSSWNSTIVSGLAVVYRSMRGLSSTVLET